MSLIQYVLIFLLAGAFILLLGILFLIWFSKYNQKPSKFVLPTVVSSFQTTSVNFSLEEKPEIFEPEEIIISQPKISKIEEISELGKNGKTSIPRNFEKKFHFMETDIWKC